MKQSVICRCTGEHDTRYFCSYCGGAILPNKAPDAPRAPRSMETDTTVRVHGPSASESTRGANTDWMTCPTCNVTGHIIVRNCKTWCGSCKSLISTCADL